MLVPIITYYARVLDNITGDQVLPYTDNVRNNTWYYGKCYSWGGESQYIVEYDIWNNEPAFNAGSGYHHCPDAFNIRLEVWPDSKREYSTEGLFALNVPFMSARNVTTEYESEFEGILYDHKPMPIVGESVTMKGSNENILSGGGDHCVIQTKLVIPENDVIKKGRNKFVIALLYDFE